MDISRIIAEIESDQNKRRKAEHVKRNDVYNDHQRPHVLTALANEFSPSTVRQMRTCTSINLSRRIVDEMASLYKNSPNRIIQVKGEGEETEADKKLKENILWLYQEFGVNLALKKANQKFKLHDQCAIQVIPKEGDICFRVLAPHQYDVIPNPENPQEALAYIISVYDRCYLDSVTRQQQDIQGNNIGSKNEAQTTGGNKAIADTEDYQSVTKSYVIWTKDFVTKASAEGAIIDQQPNPIGKLPFIDVSLEKDFEFWIRRGSGITDFSIDFSVVLSDTVNINRLQSYAQAVITAEKAPESITVGPQNILFLPLDPTRPEIKPSFEFVSPNPDMKSSLELQDRLINYFLSSRGIDAKTISSDGKAQTYSSGLERLLAMIDRFQASQDDIDLFTCVEDDLFELFRDWYNVVRGTDLLDPEYNFGEWPENTELYVSYVEPQIIRTQDDKEKSAVYRMENGLISRTEAIMELRGISKEEAQRVISEIDSDSLPALTAPIPQLP